jgi:hypothetical protein
MNTRRNLIFFNHLPKTGGMAFNHLIRRSQKIEYSDLIKLNPKGVAFPNSNYQEQIQDIKKGQDRLFYTSFHPGYLKYCPDIKLFIQNHGIGFSILRRPSDVFESTVRYFYDKSTNNPDYFEIFLKTKQIIQVRDPNIIFDMCMDKKTTSMRLKNPAYFYQYLRGFSSNYFSDLSLCSKNVSEAIPKKKTWKCNDLLKEIRKDYFALCTIEQLQILVEFFKSHSLLETSLNLDKVNVSRDNQAILLTDDRRKKIDEDLCGLNYQLWNLLYRHGPLLNPSLLEFAKYHPVKSRVTYF